MSGASIKWNATNSVNGNIGKIYAELKDSNNVVLATSNSIEVTIKSIKHIKAQLPMFGYGGGVVTLDPCTPGTYYLGAANIDVPGTGTLPEKVLDFKWLVPSGWTVQGQTSDGSTWISSGQNVTVAYPASATEGSISVKGNHVVSGCTSELQESLPMDAVTVKRDAGLNLTANKSNLLCGETSPVTFTVTPALPCAVYYWNNSQTPSTSNSFQITPDGSTNVIATVNIFYGGKTKSMSKTIDYLLFAPGVVPVIQGAGNLCGNNESYTVSNLRPHYTVSWNCSPNLSRISPQVSYPGIFNYTSPGAGWIEATISSPCGDWPVVLHKDVWVGIPTTPTIIGGFASNGMSFSQNTSYEFFATPNPLLGVTNYQWVVSGGTILSGQGTDVLTVRTAINTTGLTKYFDVSLKYGNSCGWSNYLWRSGFIVSEGGPMLIVITPNPSAGEATIELTSDNKEAFTALTEWEYEIYDSMQGMKEKKTNLKSTQTKVNTTNWKDGVYIVRAKIGEKIISEKLVVKH